MTIYKTHLHSTLLSPENAGLRPLPLGMVGDSLYAERSGPLITMAGFRPANEQDNQPGLQSYYAATRPDASGATLPGYAMRISSIGRLVFPATPTNLNEIFVLSPSLPGKENPLPTIRPGPRQRIVSGTSIIVAADTPVEKLPAEAAIDLVGQSLEADHPDFSRAVALRIMQDQHDIGRILVAVVNVSAHARRQAFAEASRKIGASVAAVAALKALKESGPDTLAAVAAITTVGVGAAATTALIRLAQLRRAPAKENIEPDTLALTAPTTQIPIQRLPANDEQNQPLPAASTEPAR